MTGEDGNGSPKSGGLSESERDAFRRRSARLGEKLDQHRETHGSPEPARAKRADKKSGGALRLAVEPLAGVLFGLGAGLTLDEVFGTKPVFLVILLLLGATAGLLNMIRAASQMSAAKEPTTRDGREAGKRTDREHGPNQ